MLEGIYGAIERFGDGLEINEPVEFLLERLMGCI